MNKKFEKINVDEKTNEYIRFVAKTLNKSISTMLAELFSQLFGNALQFEYGANWDIIREYDDTRIRFNGRSRIITSHFKVDENTTDEQCDKIIEDRLKARIAHDLIQAEKANSETFSENEHELGREGI